MRTDLFDFQLPDELIALHPANPRDASRMLMVDPGKPGQARFADRAVKNLADVLQPGDAIVFNDTRVIPASLSGRRETTRAEGGTTATPSIEANLHRRVSADTWRAFARPAKRLRKGDVVTFGNGGVTLRATITDKVDGGEVGLCFEQAGAGLDAAIARIGAMPLPPYIAARRPTDSSDASTYQTVFAKKDGAVAAPTAGLHFTEGLLEQLEAKGIKRVALTLHVGAGTFLPVKADDTTEHKMHAEWGEVTPQAADTLNALRAKGGRLCCVGTTSLRLIESAADKNGQIKPFCGETDIFITPGYAFRATDILLTNFHLPRSTLFMLVSAFAGLETMQAAYAHAIQERYRFYSYGDATLLFPDRQHHVAGRTTQ
ncbi:MAG: tRNA preQ1(34) S-adenosylmethionine ribosyltransferase-isomerase QueA [Pseudomonadota bacterium]